VGQWTRGIRIVLATVLGALVGCLLWVVAGGIAWHAPVDRHSPLFTDAAMLGAMSAGAVGGALLGTRGGKRAGPQDLS
jgi:hypothetical protein